MERTFFQHLQLFCVIIVINLTQLSGQIDTSNSKYIIFNGTDTIYHKVDVYALFPGGNAALLRYLAKTIEYPSEAFQNRFETTVEVAFIINKAGNVLHPQVVPPPDPFFAEAEKNVPRHIIECYQLLEKEALRVIKKMPKWSPGMIKGTPVNSLIVLPIKFGLP